MTAPDKARADQKPAVEPVAWRTKRYPDQIGHNLTDAGQTSVDWERAGLAVEGLVTEAAYKQALREKAAARGLQQGTADLLKAAEDREKQALADVERLRGALIAAGRAAGAFLAEEVSTDFLMHVPNEVHLVIERLRSTAEADNKRLRKALEGIANFRVQCREYDEDAGQPPRSLGDEEWEMVESRARTALGDKP